MQYECMYVHFISPHNGWHDSVHEIFLLSKLPCFVFVCVYLFDFIFARAYVITELCTTKYLWADANSKVGEEHNFITV
jgi:hypothetical protein